MAKAFNIHANKPHTISLYCSDHPHAIFKSYGNTGMDAKKFYLLF